MLQLFQFWAEDVDCPPTILAKSKLGFFFFFFLLNILNILNIEMFVLPAHVQTQYTRYKHTRAHIIHIPVAQSLGYTEVGERHHISKSDCGRKGALETWSGTCEGGVQ